MTGQIRAPGHEAAASCGIMGKALRPVAAFAPGGLRP